jgi:hypothetical protein
MVAVLAFSQTGGGLTARATASPSKRVVSTRDSRISRRFFSLYRQLTDRPDRLMRAWDPSSSVCQSPRFRPSQRTWRISPTFWIGERVSRTTSYPSAASLRLRKVPMKPVPPARIMRPVVPAPPRIPQDSLVFPAVDKRRLKQQFPVSEFYLLHKLDPVRGHHAFVSWRKSSCQN